MITVVDLEGLVADELTLDERSWLEKALASTRPAAVALNFSLVARKIDKGPAPKPAPPHWTRQTLVRAHLLMRSPLAPMEIVEDLFTTADLGENLDLYRSLALVPQDSPGLNFRLGEGLRSNAPPIFEAVAHHSPLPSTLFEEEPWNQMILKALFIGSSTAPIVGRHERSNSNLDLMLLRFASERAMAHREIPDEVWGLFTTPPSPALLQAIARSIGEHPRPTFVQALQRHFQDHQP